ncbi:unnamed protein product [Spirodela intermedia]|uniref:Uncharacterized protein n=1 Tax=Spirodela intermedia TaxID=51605 RepID=A0A7I8KXI0_SPIIN|nr:unnamed protein product [Spirodela intermedia]
MEGETPQSSESEVSELKRLRAEDGKDNEKIAGIFASREQKWIAEKQQLNLEIEAIVSRLRLVEAQKEEAVSDYKIKIEERDRAIEEETKKWVEMEQRLRAAEHSGEKAARDHAAELWRHKKAFAELVSSHRQLEAEMGRALRQVEAARQELEEVFQQREEAIAMVEQLSADIIMMRTDAEKKDRVLSAMLRKSEFDAAEKLSLKRELDMCKAREKEVELEDRKGPAGIHNHRIFFLDYFQDSEFVPPETGSINVATDGGEPLAPPLGRDSQELDAENVGQLRGWVRSEMEGCASVLRQRHYADIEAFAEQIRRKDEKLEAYRWRVLTAELQSERLQSQVEGLEGKLSSLREESAKLEDLLLDREEELRSLKKQISLQLQYCRKSDSNRSPAASPTDSRSLWSEVYRKGQEEPEETGAGGSTPVLKDQSRAINGVKQIEMEPQQEEKQKRGGRAEDAARTGSSTPPPFSHHYVAPDRQRWKFPSGSEIFDKIQGSGLTALGKDTSRKVDLHALGISYKIKRLKQQLLAFEQMAGVQAPLQVTCRDVDRTPDEKEQQQMGFLQVLPLLNKQARKYRSLEEKADGLCLRMQESEADGRSRGPSLESFLEEAFQLQRHIVAAGQRLLEVQSQLAGCVVDADDERFQDFKAGQFADVMKTLLRDIQRGLEVRVARIIGNLEGTLTRDGILHISRREDGSQELGAKNGA